jgi:hypothetical protein
MPSPIPHGTLHQLALRSLDEIGKELGITGERVRQIEQRALEKLKKGMIKLGITSLQDVIAHGSEPDLDHSTAVMATRKAHGQAGFVYLLRVAMSDGSDLLDRHLPAVSYDNWFETRRAMVERARARAESRRAPSDQVTSHQVTSRQAGSDRATRPQATSHQAPKSMPNRWAKRGVQRSWGYVTYSEEEHVEGRRGALITRMLLNRRKRNGQKD